MRADGSGRSPVLRLAFWLLVAIYCGWVLSLPLFPSLDGSLHLYYASVLASLLSGSKTFSAYYFIRHLLPPYSLHYYFLIAAAHFFGYVVADKLLVCLIFIVTATGFRYLARHLGPSADLVSLAAVSLLLNWPLGMGSYNYSLAIGMALWALGLWFRAVERREARFWIGFLGVMILMVLTHPVPTLLVDLMINFDLSARVYAAWKKEPITLWPRWRAECLTMLAAWSMVLYITRFMGGQRTANDPRFHSSRGLEVFRVAKLSTLAMFSGPGIAVIAYRLSLYALLILALAMAARGLRTRVRAGALQRSDLFLVCAVLLLAAFPLLPPRMYGPPYLIMRLVIFAWLSALAAAAGCPRNLRLERWGAMAACAYCLAVLALANARIRPVAARMAEIETAPLGAGGLTGLTLSLPDAPVSDALNYVPYYWAGARYFRRTGSTLLNGGWLYQYYLPLGSRLQAMTDRLTPAAEDSPGDVYDLLMSLEQARREIMPHVNLILFTAETMPRDLAGTLRRLDDAEPSREWKCRSAGWYSVCTAALAR